MRKLTYGSVFTDRLGVFNEDDMKKVGINGKNFRGFIRMRRKTSPFTAEISGEDCEAVLKTFNFSQAYFAAQYIAE